MSNPTWFIGHDESPQTEYSFILAPMVLHNHPGYSKLFYEMQMPDNCPMVGRVEDVKKTLGKMFDYEVEYVKHGSLALTTENKVTHAFNHYHGNIITRDDGKRCLQIETVDKNQRYVDIPEVLYQYGHLINYEAMGAAVVSGKAMRETSADIAAFLMGFDDKNATEGENVWALAYGKQLSAWLNAIWLAWMLGINQQSLVMAMVLQEIEEADEDEADEEFSEFIWVKYKDFVLSRPFAERFFMKAGPYNFDAYKLGHVNELAMAKQIDKASELFFKKMMHDEDLAEAESELEAVKESGYSVNH